MCDIRGHNAQIGDFYTFRSLPQVKKYTVIFATICFETHFLQNKKWDLHFLRENFAQISTKYEQKMKK